MRGVSMGHEVAPNSHEGATKALGRGTGGGEAHRLAVRWLSVRGSLGVDSRFVGRRSAVCFVSCGGPSIPGTRSCSCR